MNRHGRRDRAVEKLFYRPCDTRVPLLWPTVGLVSKALLNHYKHAAHRSICPSDESKRCRRRCKSMRISRCVGGISPGKPVSVLEPPSPVVSEGVRQAPDVRWTGRADKGGFDFVSSTYSRTPPSSHRIYHMFPFECTERARKGLWRV
jgi:hypothetical protein